MSPPRLLICGFGPFPGAPQNPAAVTVERLAARGWRPEGASAAFLVLPVAWASSVERVTDHLALAPSDGVLLVGLSAAATSFRVEACARNLASQGPDEAGEIWPHGLIAPGAAEVLFASAPVEAITAELEAAGLPAQVSHDAGDYLCNFTLWRLLEMGAAPAVGFLHVPNARLYAPQSPFSLDDIERGVACAAQAMASALAHPAPPRRTA